MPLAVARPFGRALVAPGPDQALHVALRQRPRHRPGDGARGMSVSPALSSSPARGSLASVAGSSVQGKLATPPWTIGPMATAPEAARRTRGGRSGAPPRAA